MLVDVSIESGEAADIYPRLPRDVGVEPFDIEFEVAALASGVTTVGEDSADLFLAEVVAGYLGCFDG